MKKSSISVAVFVFVLMLFTGSSLAFEFSADTVFTSHGQTMKGRMYGKEDRYRMEVKQPQHIISITRMDKKVVWNIMPSEKMYMEMPYSEEQAPKTEIKGEVERKLLGKEKIDGHPADKYLITYKVGNSTQQVYQWWATDLDFPVKTADIQNRWVQEYRNIRLEKQPDSLFEIPPGYSKFQMPRLPGGMPEGMRYR